jgi:hypothetical protein
LGAKQRTEKQNKIHNKNPTPGVNDTDNIGNKTENRKTKQNTQQEPYIRGERYRQHWEQNREQKNKNKIHNKNPTSGVNDTDNIGKKQTTEKQNKIHNKNPTSGVNDTDNIGNKTENRKTKYTTRTPHRG